MIIIFSEDLERLKKELELRRNIAWARSELEKFAAKLVDTGNLEKIKSSEDENFVKLKKLGNELQALEHDLKEETKRDERLFGFILLFAIIGFIYTFSLLRFL